MNIFGIKMYQKLGPCIPNFFPKFESSFESERVFRESRRDEFYVIFPLLSKISARFFRKKTRFFAKIRVGTSFRESRRVRKKLEKLAPTLIFVKWLLPKLAKTKISAKAVFRRALPKMSRLNKNVIIIIIILVYLGPFLC